MGAWGEMRTLKAPWKLALPLPIITDRLVLRPCREGDGTSLAEAITESYDTLYPWFHDGMGPCEIETSPEWQEGVACRSLAKFKSRERLQFLAWISDDTLAGSIELFEPDWDERTFKLSYWLRPSQARQGYMSESAEAILDFAFNVLRARHITATHAAPNGKSAALIEKLGFKGLSITPNAHVMPDGKKVDEITHIIKKTDAAKSAKP